MPGVTVVVAACTVDRVVPAARLSDRVGRKRSSRSSCALGAVGLAIVRPGARDPADRARRGPLVRHRSAGHLPGGRLGADDRHHPEGLVGPVHGHLERRDGVGGRAGARRRRDARWTSSAAGDRSPGRGRLLVGRRAVRRRGAAAPAGRRAAPRGLDGAAARTPVAGRPATPSAPEPQPSPRGRPPSAATSRAAGSRTGPAVRYSHGTNAHR